MTNNRLTKSDLQEFFLKITRASGSLLFNYSIKATAIAATIIVIMCILENLGLPLFKYIFFVIMERILLLPIIFLSITAYKIQ